MKTYDLEKKNHLIFYFFRSVNDFSTREISTNANKSKEKNQDIKFDQRQ